MIVVLLLGWLCPALGLPEIWPPDGRLRPNNYVPPPVCSYVQEEVEVPAVEETCTTKPVDECKEEEVKAEEEREESQCDTVTEEKCTEVEEKATDVDDCKEDEDEYEMGECEEVCGEGERCEKKCETVTEEKCETGYETEVKEECSYSTVMDRKCSLGYSVTYEEQCSPSMSCSLLGLSCRRVARCRQVPHLPRPVTCHRLPRQVGPRCRKVEVKRPKKRCTNLPRQVCSSSCNLHQEQQCKSAAPVLTRRCQPVQRERCKKVTVKVPVVRKELVCNTVKKKTCTKAQVQRPKLVNKRVCRELTDEEVLGGEKLGDQLTSYVNLDNLG